MPGFGLPLKWPEMQSRRWQPLFQPDENTLLLSALDGSENPKFCYTLRELTMIALMNELTDISDWDRAVFDPGFTFDWKSQKLLQGKDVTRAMLDWCIEEVRNYVHSFTQSRIIPTLDGGVIKSDDCVDSAIKFDLQNSAAAFRRAAPRPTIQSSNNVTDIVDPNLFPFIFERTKTRRGGYIEPEKCVSSCGRGEPVKKPSDEECVEKERAYYPNDKAWSNQFQWLPFDVTFANRGFGVARFVSTPLTLEFQRMLMSSNRISSYINNVHPVIHRNFYSTLEHITEKLLPLFNHTLIDLKAPGYQNQRLHLAELGREPLIVREPGSFQPPEQRARNQWLDHQGRYRDYLYVDLKREFWNVGLQMVLQMRDINLTPEQADYKGEEWHVMGQRNERVCATAHYVYSTDNLSLAEPPTLSFRCRINPEEAGLAKGYIDGPPFAPEIYGAEDGDPGIQHIGDVNLKESRVVVFPNTFQSKMNRFSLDDASKPGHLRLLTLYLLDPNRRIMSTAMVPCQRRDWWSQEVRRQSPSLWRLPVEVWDKIVDSVEDWPLSMEEGDRLRKEFVDEREKFQRQHTKSMENYLGWDLGGYDDE